MRLPESAISAIAFRFEALRGSVLGEHELAEIRRHDLEGINPELLARELCHLIRSEGKSDSRDRQQAYWALGKKGDSALLPFFREQLRLELRRDMIAVHQLLIALDNLSEEPYGADRSGSGLHEYELNCRDAEAYLQRCEPVW